MGQIVKSIVTSLCALVMATGALAKDKGVSYIGHCDGFILQSSNEKGNVECNLEYTRSNIMGITCYKEGPDGKEVPRAIDEKEVPGILKDLKFSHYKAEWIKDQPKLCE